MRRWINKCIYECMYWWLHKGFQEYHDAQLKKKDNEGKNSAKSTIFLSYFLLIIQIHMTISSFRTANHFTSHALKINKIQKLMKWGWGISSIRQEPTIIFIMYIYGGWVGSSKKFQSHDYDMEFIYISNLFFIASLDLWTYINSSNHTI